MGPGDRGLDQRAPGGRRGRGLRGRARGSGRRGRGGRRIEGLPRLAAGGPGTRRRAPWVLFVGALCLLSFFAFGPLLGAGLLAGDYELLVGRGGAGLAGLWTTASAGLHGLPGPGSSALGFRAEALLSLLALAWGLHLFLARLLAPWLGPEGARSAGLATALFVPLHPLATGSVGALGARGDLAALALGFLAAALFLKGRQEERVRFTIAGLLGLALAGAASGVAVLLAWLLGAAEFSSVRRHRRPLLRLRTAATTTFLFGIAAALPGILGGGGSPAGAAGAPELGWLEASRLRLISLGELVGELALPAGEPFGVFGWVLALALLLVALRPAFHAAHQAPRLWGSLFFAWSVALLVALAWAGSGERGRALFALVVWCSGLGLCVTARLRVRRTALAFLVALGWAVFTHGESRQWNARARAQAELQQALVALGLDTSRTVLVLDPPELAGPADSWRDLGWLLHPALAGGDRPGDFEATRVRALSSRAFLAWTMSEGFASLRAERATLVVSASALGEAQPGLRKLELEAPAKRPVPGPWGRQLNYTPDELLDPLDWEGVRIVAELTSTAEELAGLGWRTRAGTTGTCAGHVAERGARRVAEFDLASSLAWRLAGSVRTLEVQNAKRPIERGELLERLPEVPGNVRAREEGGDWIFEPSAGEALELAGVHVLTLLSLADLVCAEIPLAPVAGGLLARGAQRFVALRARSDAPVSWVLEYRVAGHALCRTRGSAPLTPP